MLNIFHVLTFASLACTAAYAATNVRACTDGTPLPLQTEVNDCKEMPCLLPQGSTVIMNALFVTNGYTETSRPKVVASVSGLDVDYPLDQKNGCDGFQNIRCPIDEGDRVLYQLQMPILSIYPKIALVLTFSLLDENDNSLFCFVLDAQVT